MLGMTEPFIAIPSAVLVILSGSLVILSAILLILSASLVILSAVEGSLLSKLQSCREILRFALLYQDDSAVARLDGTQACHPERLTCHPERNTSHPERLTCHPERSRRISTPYAAILQGDPLVHFALSK